MEPEKNPNVNKNAEQASPPSPIKEQKKVNFSLEKFWLRIEPTIRVIAFSGALIVFFFGVFQFYNWRTEMTNRRFMEPYLETEQMMSTRINQIRTDRRRTEQEKLATLKTQYKILSERKKHHRDVANYFVSNYYASMLIVLFSSISAGIIVFIIAGKGWNQTHLYVKAVFLVLVFISVFFSVFPGVFGQRGNFEHNLDAFLRYDNLQVEIFNYLTTSNYGDVQGNYMSTDSMIYYINRKINESNRIYISNSPGRIRYSLDMNRRVQTITPRPAMTRRMDTAVNKQNQAE